MDVRSLRLSWTLVLAILISGCTRVPDVTLNLRVDTEDEAVVESARRILLYRFGEFPPSFFSTVESQVDGAVISFRFQGGAPESSTLAYLYETRGRLRVSMTESSAPLFTERDIEQAGLSLEQGGGAAINLRLTPEAGERVHALTTRHVGKTLRMTLDGRPMMEAAIGEALRDSIRIITPEQDHERLLALVAILKSGALPASVTVAEPR